MFNNPKIWMERTHSRKGKCKVEFKGVVNKVLVTALILGAVTTSAPQAHAANFSIDFNSNANDAQIVQEYGISVEASINNIRNTIAEINSMKNRGTVTSSKIQELATELYDLEKAVHLSGGKVTQDVKNIVTQAEKSIAGVKNATKAEAALKFVKSSFGMDSVTVTQKKVTNTLKSFSDVPTNHWAYKDIMNMVNLGIIAGTTTPDANGVGTFAPNAPMTRAQFVTVVTRYLYPTDLAEMGDRPEGTPWFFNNYQLALEKGILTNNDFAMNNMDVPMTRQEMAMVIVRACGELGESTTSTISNSRIPDYNSIGTAYRSYVKVAYSKGIIAGTDQAGTFNPLGTLNRAQASAVLNRLIEPETRKTIKDVEKTETVPQSTSSWVEGQPHPWESIKAGATVTRKDGTKVVLAYKYGVLGAGQNVDIYSGAYYQNGHVVKEGEASMHDLAILSKSPYRNEMFSKKQWKTIYLNSMPASSIIGDYDGEAFNEYWIWDADGFNHGTGKNSGEWIWQGGDLA